MTTHDPGQGSTRQGSTGHARLVRPRRLAIYEKRRAGGASPVTARRSRACRKHVRELGGAFDPSTDIYYDVLATGGPAMFRDGRERLLAQVSADRYDGIVVWQLTDLTRNRAEVERLGKLMRAAGCDLHVVAVPALSLFGPAGMLFDALTYVAGVEAASQGSTR